MSALIVVTFCKSSSNVFSVRYDIGKTNFGS